MSLSSRYVGYEIREFNKGAEQSWHVFGVIRWAGFWRDQQSELIAKCPSWHEAKQFVTENAGGCYEYGSKFDETGRAIHHGW